MPEAVRKVGEYTIAIGEGKPKQGEKNALSPIYRSVGLLAGCSEAACSGTYACLIVTAVGFPGHDRGPHGFIEK